MSPFRLWRDSLEIAAPVSWTLAAAGFLGCGYRVTFPVTQRVRLGALRFHYAMAVQVGETFGQVVDPHAWHAIENEASDSDRAGWLFTVSGGWQRRLSGEWGSRWTRSDRAPLQAEGFRQLLGWSPAQYVHNSRAATAGLAMISDLERPITHAARQESASVAVVADQKGRVAHSTLGPMMLKGDDGWIFPSRASRPQANWVHFQLCNRLVATPEILRLDHLQASTSFVVIGPGGDISFVADEAGQQAAPDWLRVVVACRDFVLHGVTAG